MMIALKGAVCVVLAVCFVLDAARLNWPSPPAQWRPRIDLGLPTWRDRRTTAETQERDARRGGI